MCEVCGEVTVKRNAALKAGWSCTRRKPSQHRLSQDAEGNFWCNACDSIVEVRKYNGRPRCVQVIRVSNEISRAKFLDLPLEEQRALRRKWNEGGQRRRKDHWLRSQYGIGVDEYEVLVERQDGVCAICLTAPAGSFKTLHVDHDHSTGVVRGLLCRNCNTGLGLLGDTVDGVQRALDYLTRIHDRPPLA